ncbi:ribonucleoprotein [Pyrus ussuriensis x Pyrus communis]|uniref:Ribonucleoprotein n=1 Tax=Pyrus ussuriensis x Pyrus communis TaxID=2448454 RepID=A0A5N5G3R2_9ROSA|nr:ribonucleoprotein [Pyrus ussuriensis x Pyrus communis]
MTASTASLALPSFSPKTLALYTLKAASIAISSEFEQDEEVLSDDGEASHEPKLFVGNLLFSIDSAQLIGIFESAGNVEIVEVIIGVGKRQEDDCDEDVRQEDE